MFRPDRKARAQAKDLPKRNLSHYVLRGGGQTEREGTSLETWAVEDQSGGMKSQSCRLNVHTGLFLGSLLSSSIPGSPL